MILGIARLLFFPAYLLLVSQSVLGAPTRDNTAHSLSIRQAIPLPFEVPGECRGKCDPFINLLKAGFGSVPSNPDLCTIENIRIMFGCSECAVGAGSVDIDHVNQFEDRMDVLQHARFTRLMRPRSYSSQVQPGTCAQRNTAKGRCPANIRGPNGYSGGGVDGFFIPRVVMV
ncbi:hypothetical protein C8J57DRAFT_1680061 [Mycena rebaudengoi]|nr:hypothetical protein C8J57DRAFT_1680061 [Mycena rebaudengoi]